MVTEAIDDVDVIEREFDFGDEGKFKLKIYNGMVVTGKHLCTARLVEHGTVYGPEGAPINFRAQSLEKAVIFCPSCGARVVFYVDIREHSAGSTERALTEAEYYYSSIHASIYRWLKRFKNRH